jgi:hypothetical protein
MPSPLCDSAGAMWIAEEDTISLGLPPSCGCLATLLFISHSPPCLDTLPVHNLITHLFCLLSLGWTVMRHSSGRMRGEGRDGDGEKKSKMFVLSEKTPHLVLCLSSVCPLSVLFLSLPFLSRVGVYLFAPAPPPSLLVLNMSATSLGVMLVLISMVPTPGREELLSSRRMNIDTIPFVSFVLVP